MNSNSTSKRNILYSISKLPKNCKIAIYGNGIIGRSFKLLVETNRKDISIICFINTFKAGETDNLQVVLLNEINLTSKLFDSVIVCSSHWNEIEDELTELGIDFHVLSNELIYSISELKGLGSFRFHKNDISCTKSRLEKLFNSFDKESLSDFKILMDLRLKEDETEIFAFFKKVQQRFGLSYIDNIHLSNESIIIEGGVADGTDSVNFYNSFKNADLKIYGFEPFIETFNTSPNYPFLLGKGIKVFPWALWDKNEDVSFTKNELSSVTSCINRSDLSKANSINSTNVNGITIDSFVEKNNITNVSLLKLDIEGAEMEALKGAAETIKKFRPLLAVSIYHKKEHLYEIPELLLKINSNYKFKLGFYSPTFIDTVLYAII